jgi:hypothetical protein
MNKNITSPRAFLANALPALSDGVCHWRLPLTLRENDLVGALGALQRILAESKTQSIYIDLSDVEWADPLPLLQLATLLAEAKKPKTNITVILSDVTEPLLSHRIFLKFLAQQGFIRELGEIATFVHASETNCDSESLSLQLSTESAQTFLSNADCIHAKILRVDQYASDINQLGDKVEELLREAQARAIETAFGAEPLARDMLFQKIRKLLFELILNIAEHSHDSGVPAFAGIYARVRSSKPTIASHSTAWTTLFQRDLKIHGQGRFTPNPYTEWLELFVCDVGCGLTSHMKDWKIQSDPKCEAIVRSALKSKNPLESIASQLFRRPLSRHPRHDFNRSAVTGLQHLGHLLTVGGDYCRIYTQQGCWIGNHFPWGERSSYSRKDIRREAALSSIPLLSGTAYQFCIQPNHYNLSEIRKQWIQPSEACRIEIIEKLRRDRVFDPRSSIEFYDRRSSNNCQAPQPTNLPADSPAVLVVRPPRLISKQDIASWLELIGGNRSVKPTRPVGTFALVDLTAFQMVTLRDLFLNIEAHEACTVQIALVSDDWCVIHLRSPVGQRSFEIDTAGATEFLASKGDFWIGDLALLLRQMDSELFWQDEAGDIRDHFFSQQVEWREAAYKDPAIVLHRYLDFPHALSDPTCFRACRRSLRRSIALFPNHKVVSADDLVESLLREARPKDYRLDGSMDNSAGTLVVGSIAVTAGTANRTLAQAPRAQMHVIVHGDSAVESDDQPLSAILWISDLVQDESARKVEKPDILKRPLWRRIPNSPYIAPGGAQSVSLLRYKRNTEGVQDFDTPLYGRTPEETYRDFQRLNVLRTGHWRYGKKHDLLTINARLAFVHSFLELGPLYRWLRSQFFTLFTSDTHGKLKANILVYPSHPVTDAMIDRIKQDPGFKDRLPRCGMFPVKFIGTRTVSPFIASHLVSYRINDAIQKAGVDTWSAATLDDGVITGKHFREIGQFLHGIGAKQVYTIAMFDRSGLPSQEPLIDRFLALNSRFWRWDVPALGNERDCSLCKALAIVQTYINRLPSPRQRSRLQDWLSTWRVRDIEVDWYHNKFTTTVLSPPMAITFGVDESPDGKKKKKKILFNTASAAAAVLLELTRLTTKADVALSKAISLQATNSSAGLEIIASQLLLFQDELTIADRYERYSYLLRVLWERFDTDEFTALAGLCFSLAPREVIEKLWPAVKGTLLREKRLVCIDAVIAAHILRSRYRFSFSNDAPFATPSTETERHNFIILGDKRDSRRSIRDFLAIYRNPVPHGGRSIHSTRLRTTLTLLQTTSAPDKNSKLVVTAAGTLVHDLQTLEQVFSDLVSELLVEIDDIDINQLKILSDSCALSVKNASIVSFAAHAARLSELLYGNSNRRGLLGKVCDQILYFINSPDTFDDEIVGPICRGIRSGWKEHVKSKHLSGDNASAVGRWITSLRSPTRLPSIYCSSASTCIDQWMYLDNFARKVIEDTVANVFHAVAEIPDPWLNSSEGTQVLAHMWWRITVLEGDIKLSVANLSESKEIQLKHTVNIAAIERIGGRLLVDISPRPSDLFLTEVNIHLPLHVSFLKEEA